LNWPGSIADDHGVGQQAMRLDAAPQGAIGGNQHGIGIDLEGGDAEPIEMCVPSRPIGESAIGMLGKAGDDGSGCGNMSGVSRKTADSGILRDHTESFRRTPIQTPNRRSPGVLPLLLCCDANSLI
jgi:hypothetical protein